MVSLVVLGLLQGLAVVGGFLLVPNGTPLKIASFNIQVFGLTKYKSAEVVNILLKIVSRYDIVQVLEIRDASDTVFERFRQDLNTHLKQAGSSDHYEKVESGRLGRTTSKEQYGFLYRASRVHVTGTYQYPDPHDFFEREPFGVRFSSPSTVIKDFALVASHIQPSNVAHELNNMTLAYETFQHHWHLNDIIIAGDFNSDCSYLSNTAMSHLNFRHDARFTWLVPDTVDTTVATSFCAYDRFVVSGTALPSAVVLGSVKAYRFDEVMGLTKTLAEQVSDHYPIEMELKGAH